MIKHNTLKILIAIPIIWLFTGFLFIHGSDKIIVPLTILSISISIGKYKLSLARKNINNRILLIILLSIIYGGISYVTHGFSSSEIRALVVSFLFFTFTPKDVINKEELSKLIILSSIISFIYLAYQSIVLGIERASYPFNPIPYSAILSIYATYSLYLSVYKKSRIMLIPYLLFASGIVLTETRGAMLALFCSSAFIIISLILSSLKAIKKKQLIKYSILSISIVLSIGFLIKQPLVNRYNETINEIQSIKSGNLNTSIGIRLQLWKAAIDISLEKPIFGVGDKHLDYLKKLYENGRVSKTIIDFGPNHYHNQYLDKLVKTGIIGLALLIALQASLLMTLDLRDTSIRALAISITMTFILISLTDTPFGQGISLLTAAIFINILFNLYHSNDDNV